MAMNAVGCLFRVTGDRHSVVDMTTNPQLSAQFFAARLACQTDVSDVHAALESGDPGFVLIDSRGVDGWRQARIPGALHLPTASIPTEAARLLDPAVPVVTYCWGPGCNGATRAAHALAQLGYQVREMLGGIEYWQREGFPVETGTGIQRAAPDPLTAPIGAIGCAC
jgi:rhodanese-related sulfurtransferase